MATFDSIRIFMVDATDKSEQNEDNPKFQSI